MVTNNKWLQTTSGCEQGVVADMARGRVFKKLVYVLMMRPVKKISNTELLYIRAIFEDQLV